MKRSVLRKIGQEAEKKMKFVSIEFADGQKCSFCVVTEVVITVSQKLFLNESYNSVVQKITDAIKEAERLDLQDTQS